jgi:hypothetical protein
VAITVTVMLYYKPSANQPGKSAVVALGASARGLVACRRRRGFSTSRCRTWSESIPPSLLDGHSRRYEIPVLPLRGRLCEEGIDDGKARPRLDASHSVKRLRAELKADGRIGVLFKDH